MRNRSLTFMAVALGVCGLAAAQQAASPLKLDLTQSLVQTVKQGGKTVETLGPADHINPGELLQEDLTVTNVGKGTLHNVRPKLPIKPGTLFLSQGGAPQGTLVEFSFDGGKTFGPAPLKRQVTVTENGKSVVKEVEVLPSEYTTVRWTLSGLNPAQFVKLSVRLRVK